MADNNDFATCAVPKNDRTGFWPLFVVMLGFTFFSASMWVGANLGSGLRLWQFVVSVLIGNFILGIYTSLLAFMGAESGFSTYLLARRTFGEKGSYLPTFLLTITQVGWFGVGIAMFAEPVKMLLAELGYSVNIWVPVLLSGGMMTLTAYFGLKGLALVSAIAVPAIGFLGTFSVARVFADHADAWATLANYVPPENLQLTLSTGIAISIGSFISGGTCTADFVRFAKTPRIAMATTIIAFFIGNSIMFVFGAVGGMFYKTNDISNVLVLQGLLIPGIIVLGMNIWTTNDNALYTSGLGCAHMIKWKKKYFVIVNGALGTLLSLWLNHHFVNYLVILNVFLPPVGAVLIADYFLRRRFSRGETIVRIAWPMIVSWAVGTGITFIPWGIRPINGMVAAALAVALCHWLFPAKRVKLDDSI